MSASNSPIRILTSMTVHSGALVIELVDASKRELVWRSVGVDEIDPGAKPEKRDAAIAKAVEKIR